MTGFSLHRKRIDKIPRAKLIEELKRVAAHYNYRKFTKHEFTEASDFCSGSAVLNEFQKWQNALDAIGVELSPRKVDRSFIPEEELLNELGRIWKTVGQRPSKDEWNSSKPKYSYSTYKKRFGGWVNACLRFIEFKMGGEIKEVTIPQKIDEDTKEKKTVLRRNAPLKIRLQVLSRDNFRCVFCGRSPAMEAGIQLHLDHVKPYSKGGEATADNLQTLCSECNWGKGKQELNQ